MNSKQQIREEMTLRRASLSDDDVSEAGAKVMRNLFSDEEFLKVESVGFYYSMKGEISTKEMIERTLKFGKTIYLPRIRTGEIAFCEFEGFESLAAGQLGIMEPLGETEEVPELLVVPGLAFDLEMYRLGFGKGYYDKYLAKHDVYSIGVCYEWQVVPKLPREKHDMRMDKIIAEDWVLEG